MGSFHQKYKKFQLKKKSYLSPYWRVIRTLKKNWLSRNSENVNFDGLLLSKVCTVLAKKTERSCVVKNDLWFQKRDKEFGEFLSSLM